MRESYDVIVLGMGAMGSAALAHLATRGQRVVGLEQFSPAHLLGSSHGQSRVIRQAYFEDPAYVPLLLRAYELWTNLERQSGRSLLRRTGGLMVGVDGSALINGSTRSAQEHGLPHELLSAGEIRRRFPATRPLSREVALLEPEAGILFPEEAILAHLQVAMHKGAEVRFGTRVLDWHPTAQGGVTVRTDRTELSADRLIITAGAWFGALAPELNLPLHVERNVQHWFAPIADREHLDQLPVYIVQREGLPVVYGFPALPGQGAKIGIHHSGVQTSPDQIDRTVSPAEGDHMRQILAQWLPGAAGRWLKGAACMYTNTPDDHFVIGAHPSHPAVILAGGFSGHGFKFATVVGEVLADLATQGSSRHPLGLFAPGRFAR
jgi:sarcosine oxidase